MTLLIMFHIKRKILRYKIRVKVLQKQIALANWWKRVKKQAISNNLKNIVYWRIKLMFKGDNIVEVKT